MSEADTPPPSTLLVVDGNSETSAVLVALLQQISGAEVLVARDAIEAREILVAHEVSVALLDAGAPELRRFEAAGRAPTVIDFFAKPVGSALVAHRIAILLELYRSRVERGAHAKVVHDLRGPLHAISVGTGLLAGEPSTLRRVTAAIDKMSALIERLSDQH